MAVNGVTLTSWQGTLLPMATAFATPVPAESEQTRKLRQLHADGLLTSAELDAALARTHM